MAQYTCQQIFNLVYDTANNKLTLGSTVNSSPSNQNLSVQEIFNRVFDSTNNKLNTQ